MEDLEIAGQRVRPGERRVVALETPRLYDFTETSIPLEVVHGRSPGPTLFISAAIHGDEINGVEIIKRLLLHRAVRRLSGTLIAVPIVNIYGFNTRSRYLPDRRDLNRCFPGAEDGSLASQLAKKFMQEVVGKSDMGIDLHTGAIHRYNYPQVRGCLEDETVQRMAEAFNVPLIINSTLRDGSLRAAGQTKNVPIIIFEGGEALRFNEPVIKMGVRGILSVMNSIGMLNTPLKMKKVTSFIARSSYWVRAPRSGTLIPRKKVGDKVRAGELLGVISDPFGTHRFEVRTKSTGIVLGQSRLPLMNEGDAVFHIATFEDAEAVQESVEQAENAIIQGPETFVT